MNATLLPNNEKTAIFSVFIVLAFYFPINKTFKCPFTFVEVPMAFQVEANYKFSVCCYVKFINFKLKKIDNKFWICGLKVQHYLLTTIKESELNELTLHIELSLTLYLCICGTYPRIINPHDFNCHILNCIYNPMTF